MIQVMLAVKKLLRRMISPQHEKRVTPVSRMRMMSSSHSTPLCALEDSTEPSNAILLHKEKMVSLKMLTQTKNTVLKKFSMPQNVA